MATFYNCKSDKRYMNKSLTVVYDNVDLTYIDRTDIMNPILKIGKNIDPLNYNYVYIPDLNRYYYVSKPPIFESGYYRVELHVDVLMSFKDEIKQQNVIIKRQEKEYNLYQIDEKMHLYNTPCYRALTFPQGFSNTGHFVLCVAGASTGGV